jgi:hypothetical protein
MAEPIIPPRRREEFFNDDGTFTLRALRFFEDLTSNTNINTEDNEVVNSVIPASPSQLASAIKQLSDLELQQNNGNAAALSQIFKRLNDLETTQTASDSVGVNTAIKSTFDRQYALLVS